MRVPKLCLIAILFAPFVAFAEDPFEKLDRAFFQKKTQQNLELNRLYLTKLEELRNQVSSGDQVLRIDNRIKVLKQENFEFETQLSSTFTTTGTPAKFRCDYDFVPFQVGEKMLRDRGYTWVEISSGFEKYEVSYTASRRSTTKLSVSSAGLVTIAAEVPDLVELLKDGWKEVGNTKRQPLTKKEEPAIYQKYLTKGEHTLTSKSFLGIRLLRKKS